MPRALLPFLLVVTFWSSASFAQQSSSQTARQALLEMFFSKTPGTFAKHLPSATLAALDKAGAMANLQQYALLASHFQTDGNLQTFETGSILLSNVDPKTGQKVEIIVENDVARGDREDIELSFQVYKEGQAQRTPFMPRMTFSMKQEDQLWRLDEVSFTIHLPLADPDLLKTITEKMKPQVAASTVTLPKQTATAPIGSDAMVLGAVRRILTAEVAYAASYPTVGFSCTLADLDGFGSTERNEHQAMLIDSGLASGKRYGYVFTLSSCTGTPAKTFHLTATPGANLSGRKAFCADQSAVIRSSEDGNPATCIASGTPAQ